MRKLQIPVGARFGRLTTLFVLPPSARGCQQLNCRCDCGSEVIVTAAFLKSGNTKSCGCFRRETAAARLTTHGASKHNKRAPEYLAWTNIIARCEGSDRKGYANYGGRGITMCRAWRESFEVFLSDVGRRPSLKHSLDRINNDGNYEPGNVRWATRQQQNRNKRNNIHIMVNGRRLCLAAAAETMRLPYGELWHAIKAGGPTEWVMW